MNRISIREIKDRNDDYENTINALLCFISLTTWEGNQRRPDSYYSFGRRMTTSASNVISPNQDITPDSVIQFLDDLGFIVEAKISLPADESLWSGILAQIKKYDDDLIGWWTQDEHINNHNVILLLHMSRSVSFKKYRAALIENGHYEPSVVRLTLLYIWRFSIIFCQLTRSRERLGDSGCGWKDILQSPRSKPARSQNFLAGDASW